MFFALAARGRVSAVHSRNVASHLVRLAEAWGLKGKEVTNFYQAGLLHDIGKIGVSDRLLKSRARYTRADWEDQAFIPMHTSIKYPLPLAPSCIKQGRVAWFWAIYLIAGP